MRFPYKRFFVKSCSGGPKSQVFRPVIPIHLAFGKYHIAYEALIDSGADYSIFHAEIGEALGLNIKTGREVFFVGVSGTSQKGYRHRIKLRVGKDEFIGKVVFAYQLATPYGILGQVELFKRFVIIFNRESGWIVLKRQKEAQKRDPLKNSRLAYS